MKTKNILILLAVAGVGYYFYKKSKEDNEEVDEAPSPEASNINGAQFLEYEQGQ